MPNQSTISIRRLSIIAVSVAYATFAISCARAADNQASPSLLDRPIEEVRQIIARSLPCVWEDSAKPPGFFEECVVAPLVEGSYVVDSNFYVGLVRNASGGVDGIYMAPTLAPKHEWVLLQRAATIGKASTVETVARLFPAWRDSRAWMAETLEAALERDYISETRNNDTSIYVSNRYSDHPEFDYALVLITKKYLCKYREYPQYYLTDSPYSGLIDNTTKLQGNRLIFEDLEKGTAKPCPLPGAETDR